MRRDALAYRRLRRDVGAARTIIFSRLAFLPTRPYCSSIAFFWETRGGKCVPRLVLVLLLIGIIKWFEKQIAILSATGANAGRQSCGTEVTNMKSQRDVFLLSTKTSTRAIGYAACIIWDKVPLNLKELNIHQFSKQLKPYLLSKQHN